MKDNGVLEIDLLSPLQWSFRAWVYLANAIARVGITSEQIIRSRPCAHGVATDEVGGQVEVSMAYVVCCTEHKASLVG